MIFSAANVKERQKAEAVLFHLKSDAGINEKDGRFKQY
jgi:hypothetical protein